MTKSETEYASDRDPTQCAKCGCYYNLREGEEPTEFCDSCAHQMVDKLKSELEKCAEQNRKANAEIEKLWAECEMHRKRVA